MTTKKEESEREARQSGSKSKVLVIGCAGFAGVQCVDWFSGDVLNAADFDVVVINGVRVSDIIRQERGEKETPFAHIKRWQAWLGQLRERLRKLIKTGGMILAIVNESTEALGLIPDEPVKGFPVFVSSHDWMPLPVKLRSEEGESIEIRDHAFQRYMNGVKKWSFFIELDLRDSLDDLEREHSYDHIELSLVPIAVNRQQLPIAATVTYSVQETKGGACTAIPYARSGSLHLVPPPTTGSVDEALRILLEDICEIQARQAPPEWVASLAIPGTSNLDQQIQAKSKAVEVAQRGLAPLVAERERRECFKAILYETGIEPLQDVVEVVFKELALTTKPSKVSDEFIVEHEGRELLVEVKGNDKSAKLTDLRQLIDYQLEHEQKHGSSIESVLIVNAWRAIPLENRGQRDTVIFPDNVSRRARDNNIALLDTVNLYNALNDFWLGQTDGKTVFEALFNNSGVVTLT